MGLLTGKLGLSAESAGLLSGICRWRSLRKGDKLLAEGQHCRHIYFVASGGLRAFDLCDGKEVTTGFSFEGSFTSNLRSLRGNRPSGSFLQSTTTSTIGLLDKDLLQALYHQSREIESLGRRIVEELLITQEEHLALLRISSPEDRYRQILKTNPELLQRLSLTQLASYLGMARETLSRIRARRPG